MKINKSLSAYVIDQNGDVFERKTGDQLEIFDRKTGEYKLHTDEIFRTTKGKSVKIVRRFTREDIIKVWNSKDSLPVAKYEAAELIDKVVQQGRDETKTPKEPASSKESVDVLEINGVKYRNISQAAKALGVSSTTIRNRLKKGMKGYV